MSKLRILLPGGKTFTLSNPLNNSNKYLSFFSLAVNYLSIAIIAIFSFLLPFSGQLMDSENNTSTLRFIVLFLILFLFVFLVKTLIQKRSFIIEPKGLLLILVFNLILTSLSILITTVRVSNTFGTDGFRSLSGIALMSLIGLFYLFNLYFADKAFRARLLNIFLVGSILSVFYNLIVHSQQDIDIIINIPLMVISFSLLVYKALTSTQKVIYSFALLIYGILILLTLPFNQVMYSELFYYILALFISYMVVMSLYITQSKYEIRKRIKEIKSNILNFLKVKKGFTPTNKGISDLYLVLFFVIPFILLISALLFYLNSPISSRNTFIVSEAQQYSNAFRSISGNSDSLTGNNIRSIFMGRGSDNYNTAYSFLVNVLVVHGLIGFAIYVFLWIYFIRTAVKRFNKDIKEAKDYKLSGFLLFNAIFISIVLMFSYSNLLTIVLLWIIYSLITSSYIKDNINYLFTKDNLNKTKIFVISRASLIILLGIGSIYLINLLLSVIK